MGGGGQDSSGIRGNCNQKGWKSQKKTVWIKERDPEGSIRTRASESEEGGRGKKRLFCDMGRLEKGEGGFQQSSRP